jgi:signal transduction histidine kinase
MAALTVAAFTTLVIDVLGDGRSPWSLPPAAAFVLLATFGYGPVERAVQRWYAYAYIGMLLSLGLGVFAFSAASVGATLMLVVLAIRATLLLPLPAVAAVVLPLPLLHAGMELDEGLREGLALFAAAGFAVVLTKVLMREQQARAELARTHAELAVAHERLREYAAQAERLAAVQERNRVARDIHDGLGHALTVVQMQIKAARAVLAPDPARADTMLAKAQDQAEEALREVRRSVSALRESRPPLPEAVRALACDAGVPTEVDVSGTVRTLLADAEEALFRAAQEGLTNVRKHAGASRAVVVLDYTRPSAVRLEVRDDGSYSGPGSGFGLLGLRERAAGLGGTLSLTPAPGGGSTLLMEVPG